MLNNGCLCCTVRDDLVALLNKLVGGCWACGAAARAGGCWPSALRHEPGGVLQLGGG